jgi:hypothetical protein
MQLLTVKKGHVTECYSELQISTDFCNRSTSAHMFCIRSRERTRAGIGSCRVFSTGDTVCSHLLTFFPRSRIFLPWRWRRYVPPKRRITQNLHGITSQKTVFFIVTAVKNSNLSSKLKKKMLKDLTHNTYKFSIPIICWVVWGKEMFCIQRSSNCNTPYAGPNGKENGRFCKLCIRASGILIALALQANWIRDHVSIKQNIFTR